MRLLALLCPLAAACDAGAALPPDTAQRTALIALGLGRALDFARSAQSDLLYGALLRHLGCSATAHEETRLMGDEQELRASLTPVDAASPLQMLQGASRGFARGRSRLTRVRTVATFMVRAPLEVPRIFTARCEVSEQLARRLGMNNAVVRSLVEVYERFDGKGQPEGLRGDALSPLTCVLAVAEWVAMYLPLPGGEALACDELSRRAGGQFDPRVVRALLSFREEILAPARTTAPLARLLETEPLPQRSLSDVDAVAQVLADFADLKSTYTLGHSRKVSALAERAARALGLSPADVEAVARSGLVHDLGRVSVSNAIWDKPGPLDAGEWDKVHAHPQFTERVLCAAEPFAALARLASADHERMDGGGYPRGVAPSASARILSAADLVQALREPRPHRPAHTLEQAAAIAVDEASSGRLDRTAVNAVLEAAGQTHVRAAPPHGLTERELEVLQLLARGRVDKEIAAALGISHRTVHHHNRSIFAKLGIATRGAAALFAIEQGFV